MTTIEIDKDFKLFEKITLNPKHVNVDRFHSKQESFHYGVTIELERFHLYAIQMYVISILNCADPTRQLSKLKNDG